MKELFPGHYRPDNKELAEIWKDCLFVFDTSVILNLYRYPKEAREDFLGVLKQISDRVWMPYQVALEYQENRFRVVLDQIEKYDEVLDVLKDTKSKLEGELLGKLQLQKRHSLINPDDLLQKVQLVFDEFSQELIQLRKQQPNISDKDQIREELDKIFTGHIGKPPQSQNELDKIYEEGKVRYDRNIPPGYKDRDSKLKSDGKDAYIHNGLVFKRIYGDLIIWFQIINEVKTRQIKHIVFITDDEKEDWWRIIDSKSKKTIGPRTELVEEIIAKAGVLVFYMYNSKRFLKFAKEYLSAKVKQKSINQITLFTTMEIKFDKKIITPQNLVPTNKVEPEICAQLEVDLSEDEDIQPIVVTPLDFEKFIILDGNNRAYTLARHCREIEAIVITRDSDRDLILEMESQLEIPSFPHKEFLKGQKNFRQLVAAAKQAAKETGYSSISDMVEESKAENNFKNRE